MICPTQDNLAKPWIHFEAGALAKRVSERARVIPYLHGVSPSDLRPPLSLFQAVKSDFTGTLDLLTSLNGIRSTPFEMARLVEIYAKWKFDFESQLANLKTPQESSAKPRTDRELLEELVTRLTTLQATGGSLSATSAVETKNHREIQVARSTLQTQLAIKAAEILAISAQEADSYRRQELKSIARDLEIRISHLSREISG